MALPVEESRAARNVQLELLRKASPARRVELARALSMSTIELARGAIARRHPDWTATEVLLEFVRVHYGAALAERVGADLARRSR